MERPLVLHGTFMSGYGLPGLLAFAAVVGGINAVRTQIWASQSALTVWLIIIGGGVLLIFFIEWVSRRNVIEVTSDRIRWSLRQPPAKGDEPLSNLRVVEVDPAQVQLVLEKGPVVIYRVLFRRGDLRRLIERLQLLGVQVSEPPSAG